MKKKSLPVFFVGLLMCGCQMKEVINEYNVVPLPVTMSEQQGRFYLNSDVPIVVNASQEVKHIASGLSTTLLDIAGLKLKPTDELHENGKHSASCVFFSPLFLPTFVASL